MNEVVRNYYDNYAAYEFERLNDPYQRIEFLSTLSLLAKYLPSSGHICDVGSGPGRYSVELLKQGYQVTLFELSQQELDIARSKIDEAGLQAESFICESALNMQVLQDDSFDAVLMMGPLYHLQDSRERPQVIQDTFRI
jgi:S-adenosylmethionine-dependent methyltransferase